jgi:hypothetical protein
LQHFNLTPQPFIFSDHALQEPTGERYLFSQAWGGKQVGISQFFAVLAKVAHLDPVFLNQGFQEEVDGADIDAHFCGQGVLRHARAFLEHFDRSKQGVVVCGLAAVGHLANLVGQVLGA